MKLGEIDQLKAATYAKTLTVISLIAFASYVASYMRFPVVPLFARSLGIDTAHIGVINSGFFLMAGALSLPLGILSDRWGRKRLAAWGLLLLSVSSFLLCLSDSMLELLGIYLLFGVGMAAFGPTMMSMVADCSPSTHLGRSYGWYTTALYCGMSLGPAVGGFVAQGFGYIQVFFISGALILLVFGLLLFYLPRHPVIAADNGDKCLVVIVSRDILHNRPLLGCWLATLGGCFGLGMFITFIPLHAQDQGLPVSQIGMVFFTQGLCNALSRIPLGHLSDKVADRGRLVVLGLIGFAVAMGGFGVSRSIAHFILFAAALGTSMGLAFTSIGALIAETVPPESRGLAMGGYNAVIYFGMMLSSGLMGYVIQRAGFKTGFFLTAAVVLVLIVFFHLLIKDFRLPNPGASGQHPG